MPVKSLVSKILTWARTSSPWLLHFNSGSCNGCDIEVIDALTPRFDVERFGVLLKGTPRHADVLVCTGPVTRKQADRLKTIYEQMPEPKFVMAVGSCACSGGAFKNCYNLMGGIDKVIPVDVYVPGCAVRPDALIDATVKLIKKIESGK
ncbi:MAG: NADH-quinone oxidoreductase subunit B family protein [Candidatus Wallbacteria bacterium]